MFISFMWSLFVFIINLQIWLQMGCTEMDQLNAVTSFDKTKKSIHGRETFSKINALNWRWKYLPKMIFKDAFWRTLVRLKSHPIILFQVYYYLILFFSYLLFIKLVLNFIYYLYTNIFCIFLYTWFLIILFLFHI